VTRPNLVPLGLGPEFDRIREIWRKLGDKGKGGGDDCAIVELGAEKLAVSTDMAVEGTHFRTSWLSPSEIGWRAGAAALSDLAAVAALPLGVLASLGVPEGYPEDSVVELMDGLGSVAQSVGATVLGGDLVRSDRIVVDVVALGQVNHPILRSGASVGDTLWVTGRLGGPVLALNELEAGNEPAPAALLRFTRPEPRISEAQWLGGRGAKALIDLSDGLAADAGHVAAASGVACVIEAARVPLIEDADVNAAMLGGEEYELLAVLPADVPSSTSGDFAREFGLPLTGIGHVEEGAGVRVTNAGVLLKLNGGYRHFES